MHFAQGSRSLRQSALALRADAAGASDVGFRVALIIGVALYVAAASGSELLHAQATLLDGAPFSLACAACLCFYGHRLFPRAIRLVRGAEAGFMIVAIGLSLACLSYLSPMLDLPLRDLNFIAIDRRLGFDWLGAMLALDGHATALAILGAAYATFTAQLIGVVFAFVVAGRVRELDLFFVTFVSASLIAEAASLLAPTLGPIFVLAGDVHFAHLPTIGRATGLIVEVLRNGTLKTIDLKAVNGIISFPSMHATVAALVPYFLRWSRPLFLFAVGLDSVMLLSVVPCGNHYLIDLIGGLAVAAAAIVIGHRLRDAIDRAIAVAVSTRLATDATGLAP